MPSWRSPGRAVSGPPRGLTGAALRDGQTLFVDPGGQLEVTVGGAVDLLVHTAVEGGGIVYLFEDWLRPLLNDGLLEAVLENWWPSFSGPYLYYPGRRLVPPPLRAFIDYLKSCG